MQVKPTFSLSSSFFSHLTTRLIGFSFQRVISWPFPPGCISSSLLHIWTHFVWIFIKLTCSPFLPMVWAVGPLCHLLYVWSLYLLHETYNTLYISLRISWIFLLVCACINCMCALVFVCMLQIESIYILYFSSFLSILAGLCFYVFIAHGYLTYKLKHNAVNFLYSFRSSWKISCFRKQTSLLVSKDATNESTTH